MATNRQSNKYFRVAGGALILASCFILVSCPSGLGDQVDIKAPIVTVTSPAQNSYLAGSFVVSGTASDDIGLKASGILVSYEGYAGTITETVNPVPNQDASSSRDKSYTWSITIPVDPANPKAIRDGQRAITITATDNAPRGEKSTSTTLFAYVDNVAPTVIVNVPQGYGAMQSTVSQYIDIEGKVWDPSPITGVVVRVLRASDRSLVASKDAQGTNTWSVRFSFGSSGDIARVSGNPAENFLYEVIATDQAGNRNSYLYHEQDIRAIMTGNILPAANVIGNVDQYRTTSTDGSNISFAALSARQIAKTGGTYPGFRWDFDAMSPVLTLTSISPSRPVEENAISSRSMISGLIERGPANTPIDASSITFEYKAYNPSNPSAGSYAPLTERTLTSIGVNYKFDVALKVGGSYLAPGMYSFRARAASAPESVTEAVSLFYIDESVPVFSAFSPARDVPVTYITKGPLTVNGSAMQGFTFRVKVEDDNGIRTQTAPEGPGLEVFAFESEGGAALAANRAQIIPDSGSPGWYDIRIGLEALNAAYVELLATDVVGTRKRESINFAVDNASPSLNLEEPVELQNVFGSALTIRGSSSDNVLVNKVYYWCGTAAQSIPAANPAGTGGWTAATGTTSFSAPVDLGTDEGVWKAAVYAVDKAGNMSAVTVRNFSRDDAPPALTETGIGTVNAYRTASLFSLSGAASDTNGLRSGDHDGNPATPEVPCVFIRVNSGPEIPVQVSAGTWSYPVTVNPGDEGVIEYTINAYDIASRLTSVTRMVTIDRVPPSAEIVSVTPLVGTDTVNGVIRINCVVGDLNGLSGVRYWFRAAADGAPAWGTPGSTPWSSAPYTLDSLDTSLYTDGSYVFYVIARDNAGLETLVSYPLTLDQGSDDPTLALTNMDVAVNTALNAVSNLQETNAKVTGTVSDDDSVDASTIEISINGGAYVPVSQKGPSGKAVNFEHSFAALPEGIHYFRIRASDLASAKRGKPAQSVELGPVYFALDKFAPIVAVTSPSANAFRSADFNIMGTASDTSGLKTWDHDANPITPEEQYVEVDVGSGWVKRVVSGGAWSFPVSAPSDHSADGAYTYSIRVTDIYNKSATITYSFSIDTVGPSASVTQPVNDFYSGNSLAAIGTASDGTSGSGVKRVEWSVDGGTTWTPASGTENWNANINIVALGEGGQSLMLRVTDNADNVNDSITQAFSIDQAAPSSTETAIGTNSLVGRSAAFAISGEASDSNRLASILIRQRMDSGSWVDVLSSTLSASGSTPEAWSTGNTLPRDPANPAVTLVQDGIFDYEITIRDVANKPFTINRQVRIDQSPPTVSFTAPAADAWLSGSAYTVTGTASDAVSAVASVEYSWNGTTWNPVTGTTSWSQTINLTSLGVGIHTFHVRATDAAGNTSVPITRSFGIDQAAPSIDEDGIVASTSFQTNSFSITGPASDDYGLATYDFGSGPVPYVSLSINGGASTNYQMSAGRYSIPITVDTVGHTNDGVYEFVVTALDQSGKSKTVTRTVTIDTTNPAVDVTQVNPLVGANTVNGSISFSAAATDANGITAVRFWANGSATAPAWGDVGFTEDATAPYGGIIDTTVLTPDGTYYLHVLARDRAGNVGAMSFVMNVNQASDAPSFELTNMDANADEASEAALNLQENSAKITAIITDDDSVDAANVFVRIDSELEGDYVNVTSRPGTVIGASGKTVNLSVSLSSLSEGVHRLYLRVYDLASAKIAGGSVARTIGPIYFAIDKSNPNVVITPPASLFTNGPVSLSGTVADGNALTTLEVSTDGGNRYSYPVTADQATDLFTLASHGLAAGDALYFSATSLPAGIASGTPYYVISAGLTADSFAVSATRGGAAVNFTTNGSGVVARSALITFTPGAGSPARAWSFVTDLANKANGSFSIYVRGTDEYGKQGAQSIAFTVDTVSPNASIDAMATWRRGTFSITGTASDATSGLAKVQIAITTGVPAGGDWVDANGLATWSYTFDSSAFNDDRTVYVRAIDNAGNITSPVAQAAIRLDQVAPSIDSALFAGSAYSAGTTMYVTENFTLSGTASDARSLASVVVEENPLGAGYSTVLTETAAPATWSWTKSNVNSSGDGTYLYRVRAYDSAGNVSSEIIYTVVIDNSSPNAPTIASPSLNELFSGSIAATGATASDNGPAGVATVEVMITGGSWVDSTWNGSAWTSTQSLGAEGQKTLSFRTRDRAGNYSGTVTRTIWKDDDAPSASVYSPAANARTNGASNFTVSVSASDGNGIDRVLFKAGSNNFASPDATASAVDGNGRWTADIPAANIAALGDGARTIYMRVYDIPGRYRDISLQIIKDSVRPTVSFTAPAPSSTVNMSIAISGTAGDDQALASVLVEVYNQTGGSYEEVRVGGNPAGTFAGTAGFNWSIPNFNTEDYDSATYDTNGGLSGVQLRIRVTATDEAGNVNLTETTRTVTIDQLSDRPVVKLSNLVANGNPTLKLTRTVFGTVSDDDGDIQLLEISETGTFSAGTEDDISLDGSSWTYEASAGDGQKYLYFRVTDFNGTVFTTDLANEPVILSGTSTYHYSFVSFRVDTLTPEIDGTLIVDRVAPFDFAAGTANLTQNMAFGGPSASFAVRALASDSNGILTVRVYVPGVNGGAPFLASPNGTSGPYTIFDTGVIDVSSASGGVVTLTVEVEDNSNLKSTATRSIIIDNTPPSVSYATPRHLFDVVNGDIEVKGTAIDNTNGSGLSAVRYKIGLSYASQAWTDVSGSLFSWQIDLKNANKVENYAGLLVAANEATDTFTLASHSYANGDVLWVGAEELPSGIVSTSGYYVVNSNANTFQLSTTYPAVTLATFTTNGTEVRVSRYSNDVDNDGNWALPILLQTEDAAGNVYTAPLGEYVILVDPSGDKPRINAITYPDPANLNRVMGGTIRMFGSAWDDDAVGSVWMQIDVNGDGIFDASDVTAIGSVDWYNGGNGRQISGTVSWSATVNLSQEFDPLDSMPASGIVTGGIYKIISAGTTNFVPYGAANNNADTEFTATASGAPGTGIVQCLTRPIRFRVRARDIYGLDGGWSEAQLIMVDKNVPKIGSSVALYLEQGATIRPYLADMWVKDNWVLRGSVEDESGINNIIVSGSINGTLASQPSWFSPVSIGGGKYNYNLQIPVNSVANSTGSISFSIQVTEDSDQKLTNTANISINYDNQAPSIGGYSGASPIVQSNKTYTLSSSVTETGSGFERIAFYFERYIGPSNPANRIYNPKDTKVGNANRTYLSSLSMVDGLPRLVLTSGITKLSDYRIQHALIVDNLNVRRGGLVKVGGIDRLITAVDHTAGWIEWAEPITGAITEASIAYALVVDNFVVETPVWGAGTEPDSIINDDGDMLIESISKAGGLFSWDASINSKNIPDGPIRIHYVAFDKAGNYSEGHHDTSVQNNRPLLASVILGTDLTGDDDTDDPGEKLPAYSALDGDGKEQAVASVASSAFIARGRTSVDINVVGGNGRLDYNLKVGGNDVPGHVLEQLRADELSGISTIYLSLAQLQAAPLTDGSRSLVFMIWDSTEETTRGTDSQWAELTAPIVVATLDTAAPYAAVRPFYWNGASDNSLYGNSSANGHIDIGSVVDESDPDISGAVSFRGFAYDDQRIDAIYAYFGNGTDDTGAFTFTGNGGTRVSGGLTYYRIAVYNAGTWTPAGSFGTNGWQASISDDSIGQEGHRFNWRLDLNSAEIPGGAAYDRVLRVLVVDKGNGNNAALSSPSTYTGTGSRTTASVTAAALIGQAVEVGMPIVLSSGEAAYATKVEAFNSATGRVTLADDSIPTGITAYTIYRNAHNDPSYQVDVVPYITDIQRKAPFTNRLSITGLEGRYPLFQGQTGVVISGFNLHTATPLAAAELTLGGVSYGNTAVTAAQADGKALTITVPAALAPGSNAVVVTRNGVASVNNLNTNALQYNTEGSFNDDRVIYIDDVAPSISIAPFGKRYSAGSDDAAKTLVPVADYNENLAMSGEERLGHVEYAEHSIYNDISVTISGATISATAHGFQNGQQVHFRFTSAPTIGGMAIASETPYYVRDAAANTFAVSATQGGTAISFDGAGSNVRVADADISGQVVFRGKVWDNQRIRRITATITGFDGTSGNDPFTGLPTGSGVAFTVYSSVMSGGVPNGTFHSDTGWSFALDGNEYKVDGDARAGLGHMFNWSFSINTALITGAAANNVSILFDVEDYNDTPLSGSASVNADVVPYITKVTTALSAVSPSQPSRYDRTALGRYPVRRVNVNGTITAETISIEGFNLDNAQINGVTTGISGNTTSGLNYNVLDLSSGNLNLTVNSIQIVNNANDNALVYNQLPNNDNNDLLNDDVYIDVWDLNSRAAVPLSGTISNPVMKISPASGLIGFAFTNGPLYFSMAGTVPANARGTMPAGEYSYVYWQGSYDFMTSTAFAYDSSGRTYGVAAGGDINSTSADKFSLMTDRWGVSGEATGGSYAGLNAQRLEIIAQNGDSAGGSVGTIFFDKQRIKSPEFATARHVDSTNIYLAYFDNLNDEIRFRYGTIGDSKPVTGVTPANDNFTVNNHGFIDNDPIIFKGTTAAGGTTFGITYYVLYVDANTFRVRTTHNGAAVNITTAGTNIIVQRNIGHYNDAYRSNEVINVNNLDSGRYNTSFVNVIAGSSTGRSPGEYVSLGVISAEGAAVDDVVVLVWYDSYNNKLMYTYNTSPTLGTTGPNVTNWQGPYTIFSQGGEYCKLVVDKGGGIHIAAYDGMSGDLKYAYLPSYSNIAGLKTCVVDSYGIVGQNITIDVVDEDVGTGTKYVPYIGYYALSAARPKLAYLVASSLGNGAVNEKYTGAWEITYIPTAYKTPQDTINVGLWKDSDGEITNSANGTSNTNTSLNWGLCYGNTTANPVLGYAIRESSTKGYIETAQKR